MAEYYSKQQLLECKRTTWCDMYDLDDFLTEVETADVVEIETIKSWLYEIAINNVGCVLDGDFSNACEEIISRLDGLRNFSKDRTPQNDEVRE